MADKSKIYDNYRNLFIQKIKDFRLSMYVPKAKAGSEAKHIQSLASRWSGTLIRVGAIGGMMFIFLSDWTVIADKIPFYNKKFQQEKE